MWLALAAGPSPRDVEGRQLPQWPGTPKTLVAPSRSVPSSIRLWASPPPSPFCAGPRPPFPRYDSVLGGPGNRLPRLQCNHANREGAKGRMCRWPVLLEFQRREDLDSSSSPSSETSRLSPPRLLSTAPLVVSLFHRKARPMAQEMVPGQTSCTWLLLMRGPDSCSFQSWRADFDSDWQPVQLSGPDRPSCSTTNAETPPANSPTALVISCSALPLEQTDWKQRSSP